MRNQYVISILGLAFTLMNIGCAGPTSPFGALEFGSGDGFFAKMWGGRIENKGEVQFSPRRQVLHTAADLEVQLTSENLSTEKSDLKVVYNGRDVSHAFQENFEAIEGSESDITKFSYKKLRLSPSKRHGLEFYFKINGGNTLVAKFEAPTCSMGGARSIASTAPFVPDEKILSFVKEQSKRYHVNPSFMAGLIAQESGFDIGVVSSAKAVGLTQVTPLAGDEISKIRPRWQTDLRLRENRPSVIKDLIEEKEVTSQHDWRLNPERSVEGGILYLLYLGQYWSLEENANLLRTLPNVNYNDVILASYNSGAARVKKQMQDNKEKWLEQSNLKEAMKYVNSISSYCYHFSGGEE